MKTRKPRKARNPVARAFAEGKLNTGKVVPPKRGEGAIYNRKAHQMDRNGDRSGPYSFVDWFTRILDQGLVTTV